MKKKRKPEQELYKLKDTGEIYNQAKSEYRAYKEKMERGEQADVEDLNKLLEKLNSYIIIMEYIDKMGEEKINERLRRKMNEIKSYINVIQKELGIPPDSGEGDGESGTPFENPLSSEAGSSSYDETISSEFPAQGQEITIFGNYGEYYTPKGGKYDVYQRLVSMFQKIVSFKKMGSSKTEYIIIEGGKYPIELGHDEDNKQVKEEYFRYGGVDYAGKPGYLKKSDFTLIQDTGSSKVEEGESTTPESQADEHRKTSRIDVVFSTQNITGTRGDSYYFYDITDDDILKKKINRFYKDKRIHISKVKAEKIRKQNKKLGKEDEKGSILVEGFNLKSMPLHEQPFFDMLDEFVKLKDDFDRMKEEIDTV